MATRRYAAALARPPADVHAEVKSAALLGSGGAVPRRREMGSDPAGGLAALSRRQQ